MLTGDKVETATCIAISAGFKTRMQPIFFMRDMTDPADVERRLEEFFQKSYKCYFDDRRYHSGHNPLPQKARRQILPGVY
jgi:magnesium-transporting ATPase (P-type)